MIYKSLLPIIIVLLVMITLTTYLISYVSSEASKALTLENAYLLSVNVIRQLNNTLLFMLGNDACLVITNPINYSCNAIANNLTGTLNEVLSTISNRTGGIVRYRVVDYEVYGEGNATVYRAVIQVITQSGDIEGVVAVIYPFNLCYYSQVINNVIHSLDENVTIHANNLTEAIQDINGYLVSKVGGDHYGINITLRYIGVFRMIERTHNYTVYWGGTIDYVLLASPGWSACNGGLKFSGSFYVTVLINTYVNNTYYFTVNGVVNSDRSG